MAAATLHEPPAVSTTSNASVGQRRRALHRQDALLVVAFGTALGVAYASAAASWIDDASLGDRGTMLLLHVGPSILIGIAMALAAVLIERRRLAGWRYVAVVVPVALALSALLGFRDWFEPWQTAFLLERGVTGSSLMVAVQRFWNAMLFGCLTFAYFARRRVQDESAQRLAEVQAQQQAAARRIAASKWQSLTARVDPTLLFGLLDNVQRTYEVDPPRAERMLDELIVFLRTALSRLHRSASTVQQECELVSSYARLTALAEATRCPARSWPTVRLPERSAAAEARFPPGVLLPIVEDLQSGGASGPIDIAFVAGDAGCTISITSQRAPTAAALARARDMLALHDAPGSIETRRRDELVVTKVEVAHER